MDEISTKAVIIGVSIFVTVVVITVLVLEFTQIKGLYKITAETNVSFEDRLDEFDKYRDSTNIFSGLDVVNTVGKYKKDDAVQVYISDGSTKTFIENSSFSPTYNWKYKADLVENTTVFEIIFERVLP